MRIGLWVIPDLLHDDRPQALKPLRERTRERLTWSPHTDQEVRTDRGWRDAVWAAIARIHHSWSSPPARRCRATSRLLRRIATSAGRIATSYPGTCAKIYDVRDPNNILVTEFGHSTAGYGCRVRFVSEWIVLSGFGQYGNHKTLAHPSTCG